MFSARTILLAAAMLFPVLGHATAVLFVQGAAVHNVGDTFTMVIGIQEQSDVRGFGFQLDWDPTILTALSFSDIGTDFDQAAQDVGATLAGIIGVNTPGTLFSVSDVMVGGAAGLGLEGGGSLVEIQFKALAAGTTDLTLSNASVLFDNDVEVASGQVCINGAQPCTAGSAVPEPGSLALFALGLGALRARKRSIPDLR